MAVFLRLIGMLPMESIWPSDDTTVRLCEDNGVMVDVMSEWIFRRDECAIEC